MDTYFHGMRIPEHMREPLSAYISNHRPTGSFLKAVLCNDLFEAVGKADADNILNIPAFTNYIYNKAPSECWGSLEKYNAWIAERVQ